MKILITGNMGYIGPLVVRQLRESHPDAFLAGFDTGYFAPCLTTSRVLPECRLDAQHFGDVRQFPEELLEGVTAIVYLAAISTMVALAGAGGRPLALAGALLFYLSDGLIAWGRFVRPLPWAPLPIIVSYHLAQAALVVSLAMR